MEGTRIGSYVIEHKLGEGGMGVVYQATDTSLQRQVALKFLPPAMSEDEDAKRRFVREAQAASALDHANICTIHHIGESDDGRMFIVMPYYEGDTLKYLLKQRGALPADEARAIAAQIADGLQAAHAAGIVHRDVKPANLMVRSDGRVKILDFGVAKLGQHADLTQAGSTVGTASYMSPEQTRGENVDARSDLWSIGVVLYEMLTGESPFGASYGAALSYAILNEEPVPPHERVAAVPEDLSDVTMRLLAKEPGDRYASASEVARLLGSQSSGVEAVAATPRGKSRLIVAVAVLAVAVIAVAWLLNRPGGSEESAAEAGEMIAIFPFSVSGSDDLQYLGDGMVNLLSGLLDGAGSIRTVDPNLVLNRAEEGYGTPVQAGALAASMGGGKFVLGNLTQVGTQRRFLARVYDIDGSELGTASASFSAEPEIIAAVDALASELVRSILNQPADQMGSLAAGTTQNFEALRHYLEAEAAVRRSEYTLAGDEARKAVALDSTFALAWYVLSEAQGWGAAGGMGRVIGSTRAALRHSADLSPAARTVIQAQLAFLEGQPREAEIVLRRQLERDPKDFRAMALLSEVLLHFMNDGVDRTPLESSIEAVRLIEEMERLDPGNSELIQHHVSELGRLAMRSGDHSRVDSLAAALAGLPSPTEEAPLDWVDALDRMNDGQRRQMEPYAVAYGDPAATRTVRALRRDRTRELGSLSTSYDLALTYGVLDPSIVDPLQGLPLAYTPADSLNADRSSFGTYQRLVALLGGGEYRAFQALDRQVPWPSPLHRALRWGTALASPALPIEATRADLREILDVIEAWDPEEGMPYGAVMSYFEDADVVRWYHLAILYRRLGQSGAFEQAARSLSQSEAVRTDDQVAVALNAEIQALRALDSGDLEGALEGMARAQLPGPEFNAGFADAIIGRVQNNWYRAQILSELGRTEEAHGWMSFPGMFLSNVNFVGARLQEAEWFEEQGDLDQAVLFYTQAIDRWEDADAEFQPFVEEARERVDALLDRGAREPEGMARPSE